MAAKRKNLDIRKYSKKPVVTMMTKKLLSETLNQLSPEDFAEFKSHIAVEKDLQLMSQSRLKTANTQDVVELMEETYRGESVEETRKALMKMNRTDLVQRLSDKQFPPLSQRVETMESLIKLLLETLADLSDSEVKDFIKILRRKRGSMIPTSLLFMSDSQDVQDVVFLVVRTFGQQSVKKIVEVLKKMRKTDLAQRLTDSSSEAQKKHLDEHLSALIHKVATMAAVTDLLLETLEDLSDQDLKEFMLFLQFTRFQKSLPQIKLSDDRRGIVNDMINKCGHQSVEVIREVLTDMQRTDLVQRLSESSSGLKAAGSSAEGFDVEETEKEKHSEDERWPALIHKVETMESVIELLLETLDALKGWELNKVNYTVRKIHVIVDDDDDDDDIHFSRMPYKWPDLQDTVFLMVQTYGQQSVEKTMEILKKMKRTDLAQRLSDCSSLPRKKHSVDERRSALIHKVATMAAVKHLLLETLNDLPNKELREFQRILWSIFHLKNLSYSSMSLYSSSERENIVNLMMDELGQQSVEVTREVFMRMNRTDLVQKLSESSSASREKHSVDEHGAALLKREEAPTAVQNILVEILRHLNLKDLEEFNLLLQFTCFKTGLPQIKTYTNRIDGLVNQMVDELHHQSVEVIREVLTDMQRTDLVQRLSESSSGLKDKQFPPLSQRVGNVTSVDFTQFSFDSVETMESLIELLLETLADLSESEVENFIKILEGQHVLFIPTSLSEMSDVQDLVFLMVRTFGEQSVEKTMKVLKKMERTDLAQRLTDSRSEDQNKHLDEHLSALIHKVATMAAVTDLLLETLKGLSDQDLKEFKLFLQFTCFQKSLPQSDMETNRRVTVNDMVDKWGHQSVEVIREVLTDMQRTDLVQRLSESSSGLKDKQFPPLSQRVETMESLIELLLETLADLRGNEVENFIKILEGQHVFKFLLMEIETELQDVQDVVFLMVRTFGQQSVEETLEVLKKMRRTDLAQRLTDSSSEAQKKHLDEHLSALIHKVATMAAVTDLLLETLKGLSDQDFEEFMLFLQFTRFQKSLPQIDLIHDRRGIVNVMVDKCGHQSVEVIREVLTDMQRTDLVQRLSESSSGLKAAGSSAEGFDVEETEKEKHSEDERWPALIHKIETMESVIELLLETLDALNYRELEEFKLTITKIRHDKYYSVLSLMLYRWTDLQHTVFLVVLTYGQQSVEKTMEVLKEMKRTDLAQRLSDCSSLPRKKHSVDERRSALIHKVATMAAVKHLLLETLNDLPNKELREFQRILWSIFHLKNLSYSSMSLYSSSERENIVNLMMDKLGQQSVEVTREVFMHMNGTDLVQKLSESSSASREKHSVDEHGAALLKREETPTAVQNILVEILRHLNLKDLEEFNLLLQFTCFKTGLPQTETDTNRIDELVNQMVDELHHQSVEVIREVLTDMQRTDLVQRLSESSSGLKDKQFPPLSQRVSNVTSVDFTQFSFDSVETMESLIELLLETLADLSETEVKDFIEILRREGGSMILYKMSDMQDMQDLVFFMVRTFGRQSVTKTMKVLKKMRRTDLAQRLTDSSSEAQNKHLDEHLSALIHKVATMAAVTDLLLETLEDLSDQDLKEFMLFLQFTRFQKSLPQISMRTNRSEIVNDMVDKCGHQSVEVIREVLTDMQRTDLVQRLSESSSGLKAAGSSAEGFDVEETEKEKHSEDERWPALIHKVETMESVIELLLETLDALNYRELEEFKQTIEKIYYDERNTLVSWKWLMSKDLQDTVFLMVQTYGQQSVEKTMEVLKKMKRTDLAQRLSDCSSLPRKKHSVDERRSALIHKVATMAAVKHLILETLIDLSDEELKKFKRLLQTIIPWRDLVSFLYSLSPSSNRADVVNLMVDKLGQQSVEVTREVFMYMNRTDLVQKLPESSSASREKHSVDEHGAALLKRREALTTVRNILVEILRHLNQKDLEEFNLLLQFTRFKMGLPQIETYRNRIDGLVKQMMDKLGQQSVEVIREVLTDMQRTDLVQRLSESSSGLKAAGSSAEGFDVEETEKEKHSEDERWPALIHKVETMESVIELLLETLDALNYRELEEFKLTITKIRHDKYDSQFSLIRYIRGGLQDTVFLMVQTYGQQSVEKTMEVLKEMKRTDLAQRLSDCSSLPRKKHSVDERRSALIHKVATMAAVKHLLLETLNDLSDEELKKFKRLLQMINSWRDLSYISDMFSQSSNRADTVNLMVDKLGLQSVEVTREVFMYMNRTDLVQKLSDSSSASREKHSVDEHGAALLKREEAPRTVRNILVEILRHLNQKDLEEFNLLLQFTRFKMGLPQIKSYTIMTDLLVNQMVDELGHQSVEVIREVLTDMQRTDLVQRLSESSSGLKAAGSSAEGFDVEETEKEKHSEDERWPALIHKVETMESVIELLLETLDGLNEQELSELNWTLQQIHLHKNYSVFSLMPYKWTNLQHTVFLMVQTYGQQSVEKTMEVLKKMKRTDLAQRLSDCSSLPRKKHSVDERRSALIHKVATMAAVKHLLLETSNDLNNDELKKFNRFLQIIVLWKNLSHISWRLSPSSTRAETVNLMMDKLGQQSVGVTREVFMYMKRTDLVQKLSDSSSASREKHSVDEHGAALLKREEELETVRQTLLETLNDFSQKDIKKFKQVLPFTCFKMGLPQIQMNANRTEDLVDLMVDKLGQQSVEVTMEVLTDMNRPDLVLRLSESSSGRKTERSSELEGCQSMTQDSSDWTKLEPEVNSTDADEAPTYSLQSAAGHFECRVSGLRWVCKGKTSFQYQFRSWEGHMERMESRQYMPAGPLMDVTVTAGKLNEVHLPHWICIDDIPDILDKFAVLHIDDCGDVVEKVSEVTPTHVKLTEPIFSPRAVLMKLGVPVKIGCNVLIYQTNTAFLTLHVYLIPRDPGLQQVMRQREVPHGYKAILKPDPEKSLKILDRFTLTADVDGAEICPQDLKLRYPSGKPNFFEVYTENPDGNFRLKLTSKKDLQPVWTCTVRKAEYQSTDQAQAAGSSVGAAAASSLLDGKHFVDKHRVQLIQRVSNVAPILDDLLGSDVISQESYNSIMALPTSQDKMRTLYSHLNTERCNDIFYKILLKNEKHLIDEFSAK
ncbi:uncharacterized protein LOC116330579 isoform X3 [Oreochromis aureus]|uniref:uncharacterized protein LOC116330579 isoform X3 n=1 Tax=Oreochromis aureus TaxID=47969 RepID=UPI001952B20E|nr:uncharacterized protein LOC116330579 isoform X3 [Oreochromis aureus]